MALSSQSGLNYISKLYIILLVSLFLPKTNGNLLFSGCDKNGWKCIPAKGKAEKYDLELDCNRSGSVAISLWNFRAPKEIFGLKIKNCLYLEVDFSCGNDGHLIDSLYIYNIEYLNLTSATHAELSLIPNKFVIENIGRIFKIPSYLIKQNMDFPTNLFKCSVQGVPVDTLFFSDIGYIDVIEHHGINLTEMAWFTWHNVTVNDIDPLGIHVIMAKNKQFTIEHSNLNRVGYRGIRLRAYSIFLNKTDIFELEKFGIRATVYWFDFTNSKVGLVHTRGFHLLAQNVNIMNNTFTQLEPRSFYGIGPGLLENALVSFGRLRFTYVFSKNKILQANVGSLNPDWEAYKNVKTFMNFTLNYLPCSCSEIGWINLDDGIGGGFIDTVSFNNKIMERKSQNMCVDAPCLLPFGVMTIMHFVNGTCGKTHSLKEVCNKFINNKDFRIKILTATERFIRRPLPHSSLFTNPNEELLRPILPLKGNMLIKKTEYLNDYEDLEQSQSNSINRDFIDNSDKIPDFAIHSLNAGKKRYKHHKQPLRHLYKRFPAHGIETHPTEYDDDSNEVFDSELISHQIFDKTALNIREILNRHARSVDAKEAEQVKEEFINEFNWSVNATNSTELPQTSTEYSKEGNSFKDSKHDDTELFYKISNTGAIEQVKMENVTKEKSGETEKYFFSKVLDQKDTKGIQTTTEKIVQLETSDFKIKEGQNERISDKYLLPKNQPEFKKMVDKLTTVSEVPTIKIPEISFQFEKAVSKSAESVPQPALSELEKASIEKMIANASSGKFPEIELKVEEVTEKIEGSSTETNKVTEEPQIIVGNISTEAISVVPITEKTTTQEDILVTERSSSEITKMETDISPTDKGEKKIKPKVPSEKHSWQDAMPKLDKSHDKVSAKPKISSKKSYAKMREVERRQNNQSKKRTVGSNEEPSDKAKYAGKPGKLKVEWKMVPTGMDKESNPVVFVPKIVEHNVRDTEKIEDVSGFQISEDEVKERWEGREREEATPEPIVLGSYKNIKHKPGDKLSIHEQITNIAEKLTMEFDKQLQERQRMDRENSRKIDIRPSSLDDQNDDFDDYESFMSMYNEHQATSSEKYTTKVTVLPKKKLAKFEESEEEWIPEIHLAKRITKNESKITEELKKIKESLSNKYKNQTFPLRLAHNPNDPHK